MDWTRVTVGVVGVALAAIAAYFTYKVKRLEWNIVADDLLMMPSRTRDWEESAYGFAT